MARRTAIPLLLDLVTVDDLAEIRSLDSDPRVDRAFVRGGRLINRLRQGRILDAMRVDGALLPAFRSRDDADRAAGQRELEERLAAQDPALRNTGELDLLARYVRGEASEEAVGPAVQQIVGRLFVPAYVGDASSYEAARLVDAYAGANFLRALWWRLSGRLGRARRLLWERAEQNPHAIHATAIAFHNIVHALRAMRELMTNAGRRGRLTEESVVPQCLSAPPRLLRRATESFATPALPRRVRRGALIVFELKHAIAGSGDTHQAFMADGWSRCPAHAFVPALLRAVYRRATGEEGRP
jgi:hypothetical protein